MGKDYPEINVEAQSTRSDSLLSFYRGLSALRRAHVALRSGEYREHDASDDDVLSYCRLHREETLWIGLNFSSLPRTIRLPFGRGAQTLFGERKGNQLRAGATLELAPYEVVVAIQ